DGAFTILEEVLDLIARQAFHRCERIRLVAVAVQQAQEAPAHPEDTIAIPEQSVRLFPTHGAWERENEFAPAVDESVDSTPPADQAPTPVAFAARPSPVGLPGQRIEGRRIGFPPP